MSRRTAFGEYHPLVWDGDGTPCGHYVTGHVSEEEFRAAVDAYFGDSKSRPVVPPDAKIDHVYVRSVRVEGDGYGNRQYEWRHTSKERGRPMTYWEIAPSRATEGWP